MISGLYTAGRGCQDDKFVRQYLLNQIAELALYADPDEETEATEYSYQPSSFEMIHNLSDLLSTVVTSPTPVPVILNGCNSMRNSFADVPLDLPPTQPPQPSLNGYRFLKDIIETLGEPMRKHTSRRLGDNRLRSKHHPDGGTIVKNRDLYTWLTKNRPDSLSLFFQG